MLPNAVLRAHSHGPKGEQEGAAGISPVKEPLFLHCLFPCLAAPAAFLKTKPPCSRFGQSFFVTTPQHNP